MASSPLVSSLLRTRCVLVLFRLEARYITVNCERIKVSDILLTNFIFFWILPYIQSVSEIVGASITVQEDPGVDFWHHHLNAVPGGSRCTVGVSSAGEVGGLARMLEFAHRKQLLALDVGNGTVATSGSFQRTRKVCIGGGHSTKNILVLNVPIKLRQQNYFSALRRSAPGHI